jgi:poly-gamma-glutamate synthesis protein (capsule biosynthesis protein)
VDPATTTVATLPSKDRLVIHGVGDVNLDPQYIPAFRERGFGWAWGGLEGLFIADDLTVVNLECAPSDLGLAQPKEFVFRCNVPALRTMKGFGVEVANLGNNHSQDYGAEAMLDGRLNLESVGIAPVGAGADLAQANEPAIFELGGWKVAVLGFGGIIPNEGWIATTYAPGMADGDNVDTMVDTVKAVATQVDWVIVTIHWGVELDTTPRAGDIAIGTALIEAGADAIFGHHPHRLQPMEMVVGRPVAWSLGNFVWPNMSPASSTTAVARVVISPDGNIEGCLIPAFIESSGHPVLTGKPPCGPSN